MKDKLFKRLMSAATLALAGATLFALAGCGEVASTEKTSDVSITSEAEPEKVDTAEPDKKQETDAVEKKDAEPEKEESTEAKVDIERTGKYPDDEGMTDQERFENSTFDSLVIGEYAFQPSFSKHMILSFEIRKNGQTIGHTIEPMYTEDDYCQSEYSKEWDLKGYEDYKAEYAELKGQLEESDGGCQEKHIWEAIKELTGKKLSQHGIDTTKLLYSFMQNPNLCVSSSYEAYGYIYVYAAEEQLGKGNIAVFDLENDGKEEFAIDGNLFRAKGDRNWTDSKLLDLWDGSSSETQIYKSTRTNLYGGTYYYYKINDGESTLVDEFVYEYPEKENGEPDEEAGCKYYHFDVETREKGEETTLEAIEEKYPMKDEKRDTSCVSLSPVYILYYYYTK